ncbi:MlaD family protein [Colwellia sp. 1_MG-2023]|uniref:MlaD family protein n=1 Tax=Colwellia sp. 1_MG-2023 TaxID=3062649 RepID=UPI0026E38B3E|nr:MlaD family protein [Colwellia sp. 1_MG-2023]MDO6446737.1 MlaD family protein [Colwellia sp. 1_MG-2023]
MTDNNEGRHPKAYVTRKKGISAIWIVPIIALIFGAWLIIKTVSERGTFITVQFDNANGIAVGKTEVRYKGLPTGIVTGLEVSEDLKSVIVEIEMVASAKNMLTDKTLFWAVAADISFQGISGLETILSGNYINIQPDFEGKGVAQKKFIALSEPPILSETTPGLHINLQADKLGSIGRNSPVSYKQINVGHVSGYHFDNQTNKVNIKVFIEPDYTHLVKENSRFWNASGFEVTGSLTSGVQVKTDSLASIVTGGIAFSDAKYTKALPQAKNGQRYPLFSSFKTAEMGHEITLSLPWDANIEQDASIIYQGLTLGYIDAFSAIDPTTRTITAIAKMNPRATPFLTNQTQFYVASPQLSLRGISNVSGLIKGTHISLLPSLQGQSQQHFTVLNTKPAYRYDEPGLHLVLTASHVDSLSVGSGIFYKKQNIGTIQSIVNKSADEFNVHIHIAEKYQNFINSNSHFWHSSGIKIKGGIQSFEVQANSLQSILTGGIAVDSPDFTDNSTVQNGANFTLFNTQESALQRSTFQLTTRSAKNLTTNTRIIYQGEVVGSLHKIQHLEDRVMLSAGLFPEFAFLLKEQSRFWLVNGELSFTGLRNADALLGGSYIAVNAGSGNEHANFELSLTPPVKDVSARGLQLTLQSQEGPAVYPGNPISYRGINIGQVDNVSLAQNQKDIKINLTIDEEYQHLITPFSRFYNASGFTISGGLNRFTVQTESADTMLQGGISLFNPEKLLDDEQVSEGATFTLFNHVQEAEMAGVAITLKFNDAKGLTENLVIKYQGQQIGMVTRVALDESSFGANVYAVLYDKGKKFAVEGTQFWLSSTAFSLSGDNHVRDILAGSFIDILPGKGEQKYSFLAEDIAPVITHLPYGLNLKLTAQSLGSIRVGNPVLYRQVKVGKVIGVGLSSTANNVNVYINIAQRYQSLVNSNSKFWNTSGVKIDASIFSGINIDSQSIETLLAGGVAFATPEVKSLDNTSAIQQNHEFKLYDDLQPQWLNWAPKILIK